MKRKLAFVLAALLAFGATGCSDSREKELLEKIDRLEKELDELKNGDGSDDDNIVAPTDFSEFEELVDKGLILVQVGVITDCAESVVSIAIPNYIAEIGRGAFAFCDRLETVYVSGSVDRIGECAFQVCSGLTSIVMERGVTTIAQSAFSQCENLTEVVLPDTVTDIRNAAFYRCLSLTHIELPNVESIGELAFCDCTSLTNVSIGDKIGSIDESAFEGCTALTSVTYKGVTYSYDNIDELYDAINSD